MSFSKKIALFSLLFTVYGLLFVLPIFAQDNLAIELPPAVPGEIPDIIARIIKVVLGLIGVLALIMFIYGGITWMTSGGNVEAVKRGKNTLVWAVLGLAVVFFAYSLVNFILTRIIGVEYKRMWITFLDFFLFESRIGLLTC